MSLGLSSSLVIGFALFALPVVSQTTLTIGAAADLSALEPALGTSFGKIDRSIHVSWVTASSAMLAQQIRNGAPYDVFMSANAQYIDDLAASHNLRPDTVISYAVGRVAVLWRDRKQHAFSKLGDGEVRFVALPNPKLAPYGVAAQQALEHAGLWSRVRSKVVYGENVRQTLELFDSGNADAVITADSLLPGRNAQLIPAEWHDPILQKAGMVARSTHEEAARKFLDFLKSSAAQSVFASFGFSRP